MPEPVEGEVTGARSTVRRCTSLQRPHCLPSPRVLAAHCAGRVRRHLVKPDLFTFPHISKCSEVKKNRFMPLHQHRILCVPELRSTAFRSLPPGLCRPALRVLCLSPPSPLAILSLHSLLSLFCSCNTSCWSAPPSGFLNCLHP